MNERPGEPSALHEADSSSRLGDAEDAAHSRRRADRSSAPRSYYVCGLRVDSLGRDEALAAIAALVEQRGFDRIVTPNIDHVALAQRDELFREAVNTAALCLPDGRWLKRASRLSGARLQDVFTGRKLVDPLCAMAARCGWRVYLLGSRGNVASIAARVLRERHPALEIVGARSPSDRFGQSEAESADILLELERLHPEILFLALGAPKSEKWMLRHESRICAKVGIAVGYALDVIAGAIPECPSWMTRAGLEWSHRLRHEPRRLWRRYLLRDPYCIYQILKSRPEARHGAVQNSRHDDAE